MTHIAKLRDKRSTAERHNKDNCSSAGENSLHKALIFSASWTSFSQNGEVSTKPGRHLSEEPIVIVEDVGMEQRLRYSAAVIRD
jgi:hypothetical protein